MPHRSVPRVGRPAGDGRGVCRPRRGRGATVLEGGTRPDGDGLEDGFYLRPTILDGCTNDMTVAREEIRAGGLRDHVRHRGGGGPDRERHPVRPVRVALDHGTAPVSSASRGRCAPARSASTRTARCSRRRRSAATRLPGSARSSAWRASSTTPSSRACSSLRSRAGLGLRARSVHYGVGRLGALGEPCIALLVALLLLAGAPFAGFPLTRSWPSSSAASTPFGTSGVS